MIGNLLYFGVIVGLIIESFIINKFIYYIYIGKVLNKTYDLRTVYRGKCEALDHVFDQGLCPSCLAFAMASMLGARKCVSNSSYTRLPSPYRIFDCGKKDCNNMDDGLTPGNIIEIMKYGVPDMSETPPVYGWGCQEGQLKSTDLSKICGISNIKEEIFLRGPVIISEDLDNHNKKLLQFDEWDGTKMSNEKGINNHALVVIGWSESNWIVKNSWGRDWGNDGVGRIPLSNYNCALTANLQ